MEDPAESRDGWAELAATFGQGDWTRSQRALADMATSLHDARDFTVTDDHLALLRQARARWLGLEFGAPCIDPNRPYGNSGVVEDIADIVDPGGRAAAGDYEAYFGANSERFLRLHAETMLVLQIALSTGRFGPGRYVCPGYDWVSATDPQAGAVHHFLGVKASDGEYICQTAHGTARRDIVAAGISPQPGWEISEPAEPGLDGASPAAAGLRADVLAQGWDVVYHQFHSARGKVRILVESVSVVNPDSRSYEEPVLEAAFVDGQPQQPLDGLLRQVRSRPRPHCEPAPSNGASPQPDEACR